MLDLKVTWNAGARARRDIAEPVIQLHALDAATWVLRQSIGTSFEAPFLYLLLGADRALLLDTGATKEEAEFPLRRTIDALIDGWLQSHPSEGYELVVAHSHAHGDHTAGDGQFVGRAHTTTVGHDADAVAKFFGITPWPTGVGRFDLGARELVVFGIPGHQAASIAIWDPRLEVLLTGDTVYPGRLYVQDFDAFEASLDRLVDFADAHAVTAVLGAHIEMTSTPGRDFALGSTWHPNEAALPMTVDQLRAIRDAAASVRGARGAHQFDDFAIWNGPSRGAALRHTARRVFGRP